MPLENVTELSDEEPAPSAAAASNASGLPATDPKEDKDQKPAPKAKSEDKDQKPAPKAKSEAKAKPGAAVKTKAKGKAKSKSGSKPNAVLKRPAQAMESEDKADAAEEEPLKETKGKMKKPAASKDAVLRVNKYIYHRDGVWGIKVNGKEIIRVRGCGKVLGNGFAKYSILGSHYMKFSWL